MWSFNARQVPRAGKEWKDAPSISAAVPRARFGRRGAVLIARDGKHGQAQRAVCLLRSAVADGGAGGAIAVPVSPDQQVAPQRKGRRRAERRRKPPLHHRIRDGRDPARAHGADPGIPRLRHAHPCAVFDSTSARTRCGWRAASACPIIPPIERPTKDDRPAADSLDQRGGIIGEAFDPFLRAGIGKGRARVCQT